VGKQILIDFMHELELTLLDFFSPEYGIWVKATLIKYKKAIINYCAYSQTETIKFLMNYNSKKTICIWDIEEGNQTDMQFKTRTQMLEHIEFVRRLMVQINSEPVSESVATESVIAAVGPSVLNAPFLEEIQQ
jgi:hypothetical protein